jgi:hypothetical protein
MYKYMNGTDVSVQSCLYTFIYTFINAYIYMYIYIYIYMYIYIGEFQIYFATILMYAIEYPLCHTALLGVISKIKDKEPQGLIMVCINI